jgi:4-hydroxy-tetrahydrodipicolinate reductase
MTDILLSGCNGKMGQTIVRLSKESNDVRVKAGYDINNAILNDFPVFTNLHSCTVDFDVIVDFSNPDAFDGLIRFAVERDKPAVIATTGLSSEQRDCLKKTAEKIPVFFSANMSVGINLLVKLVKKSASLLKESFDIEIVEKHHNQKLDSPSGTALLITDSINEALGGNLKYIYDRHSVRRRRSKDEIGIHTVRGGTITGEHTVIFAGNDEIVELKHIAMSRDIFAAGALKAATFMHGKKPGLYSMDNLLTDISGID